MIINVQCRILSPKLVIFSHSLLSLNRWRGLEVDFSAIGKCKVLLFEFCFLNRESEDN